jgi:two-component system response regulator AtoC
MAKILVVDDDERVQDLVARALRETGHRASCAPDSLTALQHVRRERFDLAIVDLRLPGPDGHGTLDLIRRAQPGIPAILITGFPEYPDGVVTAMRRGFDDCVSKPFSSDRLVQKVDALLARCAPPSANVFEGIVGATPQMRAVFDLIAKIAMTDEPVLVQGETGTGKELVARAVHRRSRRSQAPLLVLNCAAAGPESLLESELFGHERGSFTGATERVLGWFESARGGTLFLDEISELSTAGQAKLLRAIEAREITRIGGHHSIEVDVRIIAATNVDLRSVTARFRPDLFHRLSALEIALPPLRHRLPDIPLLVANFLPKIAANLNLPSRTIDPDAIGLLQTYQWPGNVRELQQELKKACLRSHGSGLGAHDLSEHLRSFRQPGPEAREAVPDSVTRRLREANRALERVWIQEALAESNGNVTAAARRLGISRRTIQRLRQACLDWYCWDGLCVPGNAR